jgi:hypothetical protein
MIMYVYMYYYTKKTPRQTTEVYATPTMADKKLQKQENCSSTSIPYACSDTHKSCSPQ